MDKFTRAHGRSGGNPLIIHIVYGVFMKIIFFKRFVLLNTWCDARFKKLTNFPAVFSQSSEKYSLSYSLVYVLVLQD